MKMVSVHEARTHFAALMKEIEAGEVVVVTRHEKPVIEMRSVAARRIPKLGAFAHTSTEHFEEVKWTDEELDELFGDLLR
jgi:prevent-host-death family protein